MCVFLCVSLYWLASLYECVSVHVCVHVCAWVAAVSARPRVNGCPL